MLFLSISGSVRFCWFVQRHLFVDFSFSQHNQWGGVGVAGQVICYLHLLKTPTMSIGRERKSERE